MSLSARGCGLTVSLETHGQPENQHLEIWSKSRSGAPNLTRPEADPAAGGLASVKGKRR